MVDKTPLGPAQAKTPPVGKQQQQQQQPSQPQGSQPQAAPQDSQGQPTAQIQLQLPPGMKMPSLEQIQAMQRQIAADAQKLGMTVPEFIAHIKKQQQTRMQQMAQQQGQAEAPVVTQGQAAAQGKGQPQQDQTRRIVPGPPNAQALALAKFLRGQDLKTRTCILNGERKDMFRVKRALRALQSPAYEKARKKNPLLPEITDRTSLESVFKLLPISMLALRVSKVDSHAGHNHGGSGKAKRIKGLWTVKVEPQQDAGDDMYYVWLWEGSQVMRKVYAALALVLIFLIVLYPLWPVKLRQGVYYLSWGFLGLLGLFFLMAIFRVILFCVTYFVVPPGLWLYPNLWEDVSVMDSFRPVWAWHDPNPKKKQKKKRAASSAGPGLPVQSPLNAAMGQAAPATATTTGTDTQINTDTASVTPRQKYVAPQVEDVEE